MVNASGTVMADAILFRRAVNNLVANAIRYTPKGDVIRVEAHPTDEATIVTVANPGPGIDARHIPLLFNRFYRVDQARSDSAVLSGLGLPIVQSIMLLHSGRAEVDSTPSLTTFRLLFPAMSTPIRSVS